MAAPSSTIAGRTALADMEKCGVSSSVFYKEDTICAWAGVYEKPRFHFMSGCNQGAAFEHAYKKRQQP